MAVKYSLKSLNILRIKDYKQVRRDGKFVMVKEREDNSFYTTLKKKHPNLEKYTNSQIRASILGFNKTLVKALVNNRDGIVLPEHIGSLVVISVKNMTSRAVDWVTSKLLRKRVHFQNTHSSGYTGTVIYVHSMEKYKFPHCEYWWFETSKDIRVMLAEVYKTNWKRYIIAPNYAYIQNFMKVYWKEDIRREKEKSDKRRNRGISSPVDNNVDNNVDSNE